MFVVLAVAQQSKHVAMGHKPVPPVNILMIIKVGSKMGGEFTYPKMVRLVLTHCQVSQEACANQYLPAAQAHPRKSRVEKEPHVVPCAHPEQWQAAGGSWRLCPVGSIMHVAPSLNCFNKPCNVQSISNQESFLPQSSDGQNRASFGPALNLVMSIGFSG